MTKINLTEMVKRLIGEIPETPEQENRCRYWDNCNLYNPTRDTKCLQYDGVKDCFSPLIEIGY
jgi:hypothetical protein